MLYSREGVCLTRHWHWISLAIDLICSLDIREKDPHHWFIFHSVVCAGPWMHHMVTWVSLHEWTASTTVALQLANLVCPERGRHLTRERAKSWTASCDVFKASISTGQSDVASHETSLIRRLEKFNVRVPLEFLPAKSRKDTKQQTVAEALWCCCFFIVVSATLLDRHT